jgi:transposase InsO family protein
VGERLHLCGHLVGHGLCRGGDRCVLAADRGLACGNQHAHRTGPGRLGDGHLAAGQRPGRAHLPLGCRQTGQYTSIRYTERLAEIGAAPSVGSVGDSYDNSLAESTIGLYKTEPIRRHGPWRTLEEVELATLSYIDWFNHRRLHGQTGNLPPAELEATYYCQLGQAIVA